MTESEIDDSDGPEGGDDASAKAARREELRRKWIEKRRAEEALNPPQREMSPAEKLVDLALTPSYIAVGTAVIIYRILKGLPPVTDDDYDDID